MHSCPRTLSKEWFSMSMITTCWMGLVAPCAECSGKATIASDRLSSRPPTRAPTHISFEAVFLSMFEGAITLSPYSAHGLGFVARHYLLTLATCFDIARLIPLSHAPHRVFLALFVCNGWTLLPI